MYFRLFSSTHVGGGTWTTTPRAKKNTNETREDKKRLLYGTDFNFSYTIFIVCRLFPLEPEGHLLIFIYSINTWIYTFILQLHKNTWSLFLTYRISPKQQKKDQHWEIHVYVSIVVLLVPFIIYSPSHSGGFYFRPWFVILKCCWFCFYSLIIIKEQWRFTSLHIKVLKFPS